MEYPKIVRQIPKCLECGHKIRYGRTDKKFCCDKCRNRYNNAQVKEGRAYRRRVMKALSGNYDILDSLVKAGVTAEKLGQDAKALEFYKKIKDQYPSSMEGYDVEKYIGRFESK